MASKAELKAVLTLNHSQFVRNIRHSIQLGKDLARQFARQPISTSFVAGALVARKAVKGIASGITAMGTMALPIFKAMAVGAGLIKLGILGIGVASVMAASQMEDFEASFEVLLKGADRAREHMRMLVDFANKTPFQLTEVAGASRNLEVMTQGALSGKKGLTLVGDVAAGAGVDFEDLATTVGRAYEALRSGTSPGEAIYRLQQIGAVTGDVRRQIEKMGKMNLGADAWKLLQKELERYSGMMDKKSRTWSGLMSTFKDSVREAMRQFGAPIMETLKPTLEAAGNILFAMAGDAKKLGADFASGIKTGVEFLIGTFQNPSLLIAPLSAALKGAMSEAGNILLATIRSVIAVLGSPGFFKNLLSGFIGLSMTIGGYLMKAFMKPVAYMQAAVEHALASIPKALGGTGEKEEESARQEKAMEDWDKAFFAKKAAEARGDVGETDRLRKLMDFLNQQAKPTTLRDRAERIMTGGDVGTAAKGNINTGQKMMNKAMEGLMDNISDGLKAFKIGDEFGAAKHWEDAKKAVKAVAEEGRKVAQKANDAATAAREATKKVKEPTKSPWDVNTSRQTGLRSGGLTSGGLTTGSLASGAVRTTSILSLKERRAFENKRTAELSALGVKDAREAKGPNAFGAVRRGDRERMREVQKEKLREKMGLEVTNEILKNIQKRFDELTKP